jgi:hypothetical protein
MTKHRLMKDEDDFADSVAVDDASWQEFMAAGGVYPKHVDPPTVPGSLDDIEFSEASKAEAEFNATVFKDAAVSATAFDDLKDNDLRK